MKLRVILSIFLVILCCYSVVYGECPEGENWVASWTDAWGNTTYTLEAPCKVYIGVPFNIIATVTDAYCANDWVASFWAIIDNGEVIDGCVDCQNSIWTSNGQWQKVIERTYYGTPVDHEIRFQFKDHGECSGFHHTDGSVIGNTTVDPYPETTPPSTLASPAGGIYNSEQNVTLICNDDGGSGCDKIYYTIDGTEPTTISPVYSTPIDILTDTTLKFFAVDLAGNQETIKTETYIIQSAEPLTITTDSLSAGTLDFAYSETLTATGGVLPYSWSISSGNLPGGLTLNSSTGSISGTPTVTGIFDFIGRITDTNALNAYKNLSITVSSYPVRVIVPPRYFSAIQDAYNACYDGDTIEIQALDFLGNLYFDLPRSVVLSGGYNADFTSNSSYTTINGTLTISDGTVEVENIIIQ